MNGCRRAASLSEMKEMGGSAAAACAASICSAYVRLCWPAVASPQYNKTRSSSCHLCSCAGSTEASKVGTPWGGLLSSTQNILMTTQSTAACDFANRAALAAPKHTDTGHPSLQSEAQPCTRCTPEAGAACSGKHCLQAWHPGQPDKNSETVRARTSPHANSAGPAA